MSGVSNDLKDQARALRALADRVEQLLDPSRRRLSGMIHGKLFVGPAADETGLGLNDLRRRLQHDAEALRDEAHTRENRAARIENSDSALTDLTDLVTGRDFTPWS